MTITPEDLVALKRHPLFRALSDDDIREILGGAAPRVFRKGDVLFHRGDPADHFYFIFDGWVKIGRETADGNEAVFGVFTDGETIAEAVAFTDDTYPATGQVVEDARLLAIRSKPMMALLAREPHSALAIIASLSRRFHQLIGEIERLKTQTATQRVCEFLLRRCAVDEGSAMVALPYDKTVISARLGMKPESLSRILGKLRKAGVRTERDRVTIADVAALAQFCVGEGEEDSYGDLGA